jgi:hypothetical protein
MNSMQNSEQHYKSFAKFYPFYLEEHRDRRCRRLHFVGTSLVLIIFVLALLTGHWLLLWGMPLAGYGFAWGGHFFFEKNRPATFRYPLYSFMGDWVMYFDILRGKIKI